MVPHVAENGLAHWALSSSSGRNQVGCTLLRYSEKSGALICHIQVTWDFWQRGLIKQSTEVSNDFHVVLPQVLMDIDALKILRERLLEWQINPSAFSVELGVRGEGDQKLIFSIGQDEGLIYSADRPAASLSYACGRAMEGRWAWVVDQSCIRLCAESIKDFVREAGD